MKKVILFLACLFLAACSSTQPDPDSLFKGQSEMQIFKDGEKALEGKHYEDAIQHFETLNTRYPFSTYAEQGLLDLIYAYYEHEDLPSSFAAADQYVRLYPRGEGIAYAYYMRGLIQFGENRGFFEKYFKTDFAQRDLTDFKKAYADFSQVVRYYPRSAYAPDSRKHMVYIVNTLAKFELQNAQFYYDHKSYVAAANRANEVVQHYEGTTVVPDALALMVKSYRALGLDKEAADALRVLSINFPNSPLLKTIKN